MKQENRISRYMDDAEAEKWGRAPNLMEIEESVMRAIRRTWVDMWFGYGIAACCFFFLLGLIIGRCF